MTSVSNVTYGPRARRQVPRRLVRAALLAASVAAILPCMSGAASAGFFEALFGRREAPQPVYMTPSPRQYLPLTVSPLRPHMRAAVRPKPAVRTLRATAAPVKTVAARPAALPGPLGPFLLDPTLRRGDVVVTSDGLKIFTGVSASQHSTSEFTGLAQGAQFAAGKSSVLTSIDAANRFSLKPLEEVHALPAAAAQPAVPSGKQASLGQSPR